MTQLKQNREKERLRKRAQRRKKKIATLNQAEATQDSSLNEPRAQTTQTTSSLVGPSSPTTSRSTVWRQSQSSQKKRRLREKDCKRKTEGFKRKASKKGNDRLRVALFRHKKTSEKEGFASNRSERRAAKRVSEALPNTPAKETRILLRMSQSPHAKKILVQSSDAYVWRPETYSCRGGSQVLLKRDKTRNIRSKQKKKACL